MGDFAYEAATIKPFRPVHFHYAPLLKLSVSHVAPDRRGHCQGKSLLPASPCVL
ncbi:hypothetical protein DVDV_1589 [Desulfovibrio sp. DV]|nr:hypothetical protein DVDV_1589 [Desulfovibrio sp. DV]